MGHSLGEEEKPYAFVNNRVVEYTVGVTEESEIREDFRNGWKEGVQRASSLESTRSSAVSYKYGCHSVRKFGPEVDCNYITFYFDDGTLSNIVRQP